MASKTTWHAAWVLCNHILRNHLFFHLCHMLTKHFLLFVWSGYVGSRPVSVACQHESVSQEVFRFANLWLLKKLSFSVRTLPFNVTHTVQKVFSVKLQVWNVWTLHALHTFVWETSFLLKPPSVKLLSDRLSRVLLLKPFFIYYITYSTFLVWYFLQCTRLVLSTQLMHH